MEAKQQTKKKSHTPLLKAVKNINKLIKDGDINVKTNNSSSAVAKKLVKSETGVDADLSSSKLPRNGKNDTKSKNPSKVYPDRGVVYLAHIPHGFYEDEMKAFFSQFGHVTRVRLVRSHKTGNSRGFAFVEFRFLEVAQVVAETMNNYLMRNRLLKATYIPPEKQNPKMFLNSTKYGPETCIGVINQRRAVKCQNRSLSRGESDHRVNRQKQHLIKLQEKLKAQGVDCLFQIDGGTSKQLLEERENSLPPTKRARTDSPAPKAKSTVPLKQPTVTPTSLKKQSSAVKGQTSQKSLKSIKVEKIVDKGQKKSNSKKVEKKKIVQKKVVAAKVVKKNAKAPTAKKDASKKLMNKKTAPKKK